MRRRIRQWIDDLQLLDDRAGPPVRDEERQRIGMFRADMNEMDVQPVDRGNELRQGVQLCLDLAPVVPSRPIAGELLNRRELYSLRRIRYGLLRGPTGCPDPSPEIGECLVRHMDPERSDRCVRRG